MGPSYQTVCGTFWLQYCPIFIRFWRSLQWILGTTISEVSKRSQDDLVTYVLDRALTYAPIVKDPSAQRQGDL